MNLYLAVNDADYTPQERLRLSHGETEIQPGWKTSMGEYARVWTILDIDIFELEDQTDPQRRSPEVLRVAHCAPDPGKVAPRQEWFNVDYFRERPLANLQIFTSEDGAYLTESWDFEGKRPKLMKLLPSFNVAEHTVGSQPWGTVAIDFYRPQERSDMFTSGIYIVHCVYVPEALRAVAISP